MISTLRDVRTQLGVAVGTVVTCFDTVPAAPTPPMAIVWYPERIELQRTLKGHSELTMTVTVYVGLADVDSGQTTLDGLLNSVPEAIKAHTTDVWETVNVESVLNIRPETVANAETLAADFLITIIA